jgi:uncharacterized protein (TIGR02270 family)
MASPHRAAEPFQDLIDESLDEAAFLWRRWEGELTSLTRSLDEVWSWTEDRLHGALDGVRVAGPRVVDAAMEGLLSSDLDVVPVWSGVLASSAERGATDVLASALATAEGERLGAMVRGLELLGSGHALRAAAAVFGTERADHAAALCRLKAFHRATAGGEMRTALESGIPAAQREAMRAAANLRSPRVEEWIVPALNSADGALRSAAVESGLCCRSRDAWSAAAGLSGRLDAHAGPFLKYLAMLGSAEEHEIVFGALRVPALQQDAIWALGHIGTVRAAETCLAGLEHETLARACAEAYCWITGADLSRDHLAAADAPPDAPAFEDDDLDADLVPSAEAMWPLPDVEAVRQHWHSRRSGFAADVRYVLGQPATMDTLAAAIERGPMLRRPDLVRELRIRTGSYDVETRAFTSRQRQMMAAGRAALSGGGGR